MEVERLIELCEDREKGLALSKIRNVARNMVKRCADTAMMNTIIAKIEPTGLNGNIRTIWHTSRAGRRTQELEHFFSALHNDEPMVQADNDVSQIDLRHYDSYNNLVLVS